MFFSVGHSFLCTRIKHLLMKSPSKELSPISFLRFFILSFVYIKYADPYFLTPRRLSCEYPLDDSLSNTTCCSNWIVNFWKRYICIHGPFLPAFLLNYAWILCINSWASLCKFRYFFSVWKQGHNTAQRTDANLQQRSSAADAYITQLLNRPKPLLVSRPTLRWSVTHTEQNLTSFKWKTLWQRGNRPRGIYLRSLLLASLTFQLPTLQHLRGRRYLFKFWNYT
jgi:hypothetical protein